MRTARVRLPLERRKISALDIVEAIAILTVFAALTLSAHAQVVQPAGGDPTQISVSHDRTALPTAMSTGRSLLDSADTPRTEHGEQPLLDYVPSPKPFVSLGDIARAWRTGRGDPKLRIVWMPYDR